MEDTSLDIRERIIEATIEEFNDKGTKLTMDGVAKRLSMSKKTLYTIFKDKEELIIETVEYCFTDVKKGEQKILEDPTLDLVEKLKRIIIVLPENFTNIDYRKLYDLKAQYPKIYRRIEERIENDWEPTIALLEEGMRQGKIRKISIPILKAMVEATMEHFITSTLLIDEEVCYTDALNEMMEILMRGIRMPE